MSGNNASGESSRGGGIDAYTVILQDSLVTNNDAQSGGGILAGAAEITGSTISNNTSDYTGGGIFTDTLTLIDSAVSGNVASGGNTGGTGGGIAAYAATVMGSTVSGNVVRADEEEAEGGGIAADELLLINSTVSGNRALAFSGYDAYGAGIAADTATLINSTVAGNEALGYNGSSGGGAGVTVETGLILANSIVADNAADPGAPDDVALLTGATLTLEGGNLVEDGSVTGAGVLNVDPKVGPLAGNGGATLTRALLPGSPAIDAGVNAAAVDENGDPLVTDQRGEPRLADGDGNGSAIVDLGAFEVPAGGLPTPDPFFVTTGADVDDPNDFVTSLREAVAAANADPGPNTITFASGVTTATLEDALPQLEGELVIVGGGVTIDANADGDFDPSTGPGREGVAGAGRRAFDLAAGADVTLSDLRLTGGSVDEAGGAVRVAASASLTIDDARLDLNQADEGGGAIANAGSLWLTNTVIDDNATFDSPGGGVFNSGSATVESTTFSNNFGYSGGGGFFNSGSFELVDSRLTKNSVEADWGYGAILNDGELVIRRSIIDENRGDYGGGIGNDGDGILKIYESALFGNDAAVGAGALHNFGTLFVENSTIYGNDGSAGGLANYGQADLSHVTVTANSGREGFAGTGGAGPRAGGIANVGDLTLNGSIVSGNTISPSGYPPIGPAEPNLLGSLSGANNLIDADVATIFVAGGVLADNGGPTPTVALLDDPANPALDVVSGPLVPATDQRGVLRPQGTASDIGAFELEQGPVGGAVQVAFVSQSAGFDNLFGWYDRTTNAAQLLIADTKNAEGFVATLPVADARDVGFFLVPDGADPFAPGGPFAGIDPLTLELEVVEERGRTFVATTAGEALLGRSPGQGFLPLAFFTEAGLNPDGFDHVRERGDALFWEDLFGGGDRDFNDLVVTVETTDLVMG